MASDPWRHSIRSVRHLHGDPGIFLELSSVAPKHFLMVTEHQDAATGAASVAVTRNEGGVVQQELQEAGSLYSNDWT